MRLLLLLTLVLLAADCSAQERISQKTFPEITLTNRIEFADPQNNQPRFSCGFLLRHRNDTFAVTAKHLLKVIKTKEMNTVSFGRSITGWSLFSLSNPQQVVVADKLLNESKTQVLKDKATFGEDWLVFSIRSNHSTIKPLEIRTTPLVPGEKLYVVGWTRHMESGPQRVYEFSYYKTVGNRILLKDLLVPEQFGGLSGAPLVDEQGLVVGIVSNGTEDGGKKYFSPCSVTGLAAFLEKNQLAK
ncbi:S1 family peptidase [Hymenobacter sp. BT175]|uniref:trypsin-like serine protease n=1 Tax=Hymenobacter translucens TaxID=2886507 RepID=UPI001D0EFB5D|nr:trypsin-like serine protease [Hymenobacter translucens]MCC2546614.1 S1 family peptidase [Hymenobacter translucens]